MYKTLIDAEKLAENIGKPDWVIVDCRFSLADTAVGYQNYQQAHIPGAVYAHLDNDLSSVPVTDHGRHPLPTPQRLARLLGLEAATLSAICPIDTATALPSRPNHGGRTVMKTHA